MKEKTIIHQIRVYIIYIQLQKSTLYLSAKKQYKLLTTRHKTNLQFSFGHENQTPKKYRFTSLE